jgi:hypothetical protein
MVPREEIKFSQKFVDRFFRKWPLCQPFGHRCKHAFTMEGHLDGNGQHRLYCRKTDTGKGSYPVRSQAKCPIGYW